MVVNSIIGGSQEVKGGSVSSHPQSLAGAQKR